MRKSANPEFTPPKELSDKYEVIECLSIGTQSETYLVKSRKSGGYLLLKSYSKAKNTAKSDEYSFLCRLEHPAIPKAAETFETAEQICLVREFVEGESLDKLDLPLDENSVIVIAKQLCEILEYLHGQSPPLIHRDIKPQNVILDSHGKIHLIDFGIARQFSRNPEKTKDTALVLTEGYAPPEQYGFKQTDCRSDIYSLGILLCYLLTGEIKLKYLKSIKNQHLARAIAKCSAFNPNDRYPTATAVKAALAPALSNPDTVTVRLMARDVADETALLYPYQSNPIEIVKDGTYTARIDIPARTSITALSLQTDGSSFNFPNSFSGVKKAPTKYAGALLTFDNIIVNDSIPIANIKGTTSFVYDDASYHGHVCNFLWDSWHKPHQLLTDIIPVAHENQTNGGVNFGVVGAPIINNIKVTFTVSGIDTPVPPEAIPVRLIAKDVDGMLSTLVPYRSRVVTIAQSGSYSVEIAIPKRKNLVSLALKTDGISFNRGSNPHYTKIKAAPERWKNARLKFDSVIINDTPVGNCFDDFLVSPNGDFAGYVSACLWDGWIPSERLLEGVTTVDTATGSVSFGSVNGEVLEVVKVVFSVTGG